MNLADNIRLALRGLVSNGMRSVLTVLGIFIGVLAVILGTAIGQGARTKILGSIQTLGANSIVIFPTSEFTKTAGDPPRVTERDALALKANCPSLLRVVASFTGRASIKAGKKSTNAQISCSQPDYFPMRELSLAAGREYTLRDLRGRRKVVILGSSLSQTLFGKGVDPAAMLGRRVRIQGVGFTVVGVLKSKGASPFDNLDEYAFVPLSTGMKGVFGARDPSELYTQAVSEDKTDAAKREIIRALRKTHRIKRGAKNDFQVFSQQQLLTLGNTTTAILTGLLSGIAGIALLVGGIGIMNIMLVSVTERTREIGIRKAIGARPRDIRLQFLVEATTLSLCGGLAGILAGVGISALIRLAFDFPAAVSPFWAALAFSVSAGIGVFFGLYPASKAAALDPIDALRYQ